jgi:hypothetical protein
MIPTLKVLMKTAFIEDNTSRALRNLDVTGQASTGPCTHENSQLLKEE